MEKRYYKSMKVYKILLLICTIFIGLGAMVGGLCMIIKPDGSILQMQNLLEDFKKLPFNDILFKDYLFSGFSLIIVNGITNIIATIFILMNKKIGFVLGTIFGITLILWICIQFYLFAPTIYLIDIIFFLIGLFQSIVGFCSYVNYQQINFHFDTNDYPIINYSNKDNIVFFFSRMGYTKKLAYEKANKLQCGIYEITTNEKIHGILGFWWCGRFGMHQWAMDTNPLSININDYKNIYLFSPIWVFHISAPMRDFISKNKASLHNVHFTLVHFQPIKYKKEFNRIEHLINSKLLEKTTICSQNSNIKFIKKI